MKITNVRINDDCISLDIFGQTYTTFIYHPEYQTDKEFMLTVGNLFKELGKCMINTAEYGVPSIEDHFLTGEKFINIGFDKDGKVIIPELKIKKLYGNF
jgi:hypothetical protein